jgi:predicted hydrocarbon binding protein
MALAYQSPRRMCWLAHGFIEGAADHFGETVEIEHQSCMLENSPVCRLAMRWSR